MQPSGNHIIAVISVSNKLTGVIVTEAPFIKYVVVIDVAFPVLKENISTLFSVKDMSEHRLHYLSEGNTFAFAQNAIHRLSRTIFNSLMRLR